LKLKPTMQATLLATMLLPGVAFAQSAAPNTAPPPAKPEAAQTAAPAGRHARGPDSAARVEQRINQLHSELGITPAEQQQWDQFAQVMRDNAKAMDQRLDERGTQLTSMNAAQDMQSYAELSAQHAQDMQKLSAAFQSLYSAMPDEQKQTADQVFRGHLEHGRHGSANAHHGSQTGSSG